MILAASSMKSLFWLLHLASKSAWTWGFVKAFVRISFTLLTSWARSLESLRMEKRAGSVQPLFSTKNLKKRLNHDEHWHLRLQSRHLRYKSWMLLKRLPWSPLRNMRTDQHILDSNLVPGSHHAPFISIQQRALTDYILVRQLRRTGNQANTVGFRNSFTRSFPCGLVGRRRNARVGPFSSTRESFSWVMYVEKSMGISEAKKFRTRSPTTRSLI